MGKNFYHIYDYDILEKMFYVCRLFPDHTFLDVRKFKTLEETIKYIEDMDGDYVC